MRHEFTTVSSRDVHIGRVVGLRVDEVVMPDGATASREVVEHLGAVAVAAVDDDGLVTLIHQYRHPLGKRLWELPAGLLDSPAEQPVEAARRELVEEVGLAAREWVTLVDVAASPGFTDEVVRVFLARGLSDVERELMGEEEADLEMRKVPLDDAVAMALAGEIVNGAAVAGVLAAQAVLSGRAQGRPADAPFTDRPTKFASRTS
ncbi:NUDIX hydrolase [Actinosynnema sp. NPDC047251]|uniref:NTP pyrophosphohydrolase n=1 Tax=Saccharothrix espanaensis (strain ATCC 51144 / DSM 44229 / JCM 9112 / NBRC 15066 / NRRL 15764) TaxID=1179773 RepID=K0K677_SACES|nr:NUDIX hydrolase [Saccharothrix espanaensis]CCH33811.1 NTP pyrophosphohydrolase [Saccharothrix espanaensis DSM 44229]